MLDVFVTITDTYEVSLVEFSQVLVLLVHMKSFVPALDLHRRLMMGLSH